MPLPSVVHVDRLKSHRFGALSVRSLLKAGTFRGASVLHERVAPGGKLPCIYHKRTFELVYCLSGRGHAYLDGRKQALRPGVVIWIPPGMRHRFVAGSGAMEALSIFWPALKLTGRSDVFSDERKNGALRRRGAAGRDIPW